MSLPHEENANYRLRVGDAMPQITGRLPLGG